MNRLGKKFNRLSPIKFMGMAKSGSALWLCRCDCGKEKILAANKFAVKNGVRSCGCLVKEFTGSINRSHGLSKTPDYHVWSGMRDRCGNPASKNWDRYGGRGIKVCERWSKFENFIRDMGKRPSAGHSIDRINNDGNYEPSNCRWATHSQQCRNKSTNFLVEFNGERLCIKDWSKKLGWGYATLSMWIKRGKPLRFVLIPKVKTRLFGNRKGSLVGVL